MKRLLLVTILLLFGTTQTLRAEQLKIFFTGTVADINDSVGELDDLSIGNPVTGYYIYDLNATDSNADPTIGYYNMSDDPTNRMSITVGDRLFDSTASPQFTTQVFDNSSGKDGVIVSSLHLMQEENPCLSIMGLILYDFTETAFSDDTLPQNKLDLGQFTQKIGSIDFFGDCSTTPVTLATLTFSIDTLSLHEPGIPTVSTWGLGILAMFIAIGATLLLRRKYISEIV